MQTAVEKFKVKSTCILKAIGGIRVFGLSHVLTQWRIQRPNTNAPNWLIAFALSQVGTHQQATTSVSFNITRWVFVSYLAPHEEFPQVIAGLWNVDRRLTNLFFCHASTVGCQKCIVQDGDIGEHEVRVPCWLGADGVGWGKEKTAFP